MFPRRNTRNPLSEETDLTVLSRKKRRKNPYEIITLPAPTFETAMISVETGISRSRVIRILIGAISYEECDKELYSFILHVGFYGIKLNWFVIK